MVRCIRRLRDRRSSHRAVDFLGRHASQGGGDGGARRVGLLLFVVLSELDFGAQVASLAHTDGRKTLLAVLYDEAARREWEDTAGKLGEAFDVSARARHLSDDTLRRARALYDSLFSKSMARPEAVVRFASWGSLRLCCCAVVL